MSDNSYTVEVKPASLAGYYTREQSNAYYSTRYARNGVTYHWWNKPSAISGTAASHDSIVKYLSGRAAAGQAPTANYVASEPKLTLLGSPDLVSWCSGAGNPTTIAVECSPHLTEAFYKKLGWFHDQMEQRYDKTMAIYVHFEWSPGTECSPIVKQKIRDYANWWKDQRKAPTPVVTVPEPTPPKTVTLQIADITNKKVRLIRDANLWDLAFERYADAKSVKTLPVGTILEVSATAEHPLGSTYYLSEYSYSRGVGNGINVKDCEDYTDPIAPPKETSVIQPPKTAPINEAPVITPTPTPVEIPLTKDEEQDKRLSAIEALLTKVVEFLSAIFKNFK